MRPVVFEPPAPPERWVRLDEEVEREVIAASLPYDEDFLQRLTENAGAARDHITALILATIPRNEDQHSHRSAQHDAFNRWLPAGRSVLLKPPVEPGVLAHSDEDVVAILSPRGAVQKIYVLVVGV